MNYSVKVLVNKIRIYRKMILLERERLTTNPSPGLMVYQLSDCRVYIYCNNGWISL